MENNLSLKVYKSLNCDKAEEKHIVIKHLPSLRNSGSSYMHLDVPKRFTETKLVNSA